MRVNRRAEHAVNRRLQAIRRRGTIVITGQPGAAGTAQSPRAQKAIRSMRAGAWR